MKFGVTDMADDISDNNSDASPPIREVVGDSSLMRMIRQHIYAPAPHRAKVNHLADYLRANGHAVRQIVSEAAGQIVGLERQIVATIATPIPNEIVAALKRTGSVD